MIRKQEYESKRAANPELAMKPFDALTEKERDRYDLELENSAYIAAMSDPAYRAVPVARVF